MSNEYLQRAIDIAKGLGMLFPQASPQPVGPHVRWMIRRDYPMVLAIEHMSFPNPWSEEEFTKHHCRRDTIGMVAEHHGLVIGYVIYELHKRRLTIKNIAVHPDARRCGVGSAIVERLVHKLDIARRNSIDLVVRDHNLSAHLFWKSNGFVATDYYREWFDDGQDGIRFEYRIGCE